MPIPPTDESPALLDDRLRQAYRTAHYWVNGLLLQIGQPQPDFDHWLARRGYRDYSLITAYNPFSTPLSAPVNEARHRTLVQLVERLRLPHVAASGSDPGGSWPDEHGLCIFAPGTHFGRHLGRIYQQHAIVVGSRGSAPRLLYL